MRRSYLGLVVLCLGCMSAEEAAKVEAGLAVAGPWDIPADVAAVGDTQHIEYTGAGPWRGPSGCGGSLSAGAAVLRDYIGESFPQVTHVGGYSCRSINGDSSTMSVHATGRALDIHIPLHGGEADNDLGDPVAHYFIEHAEEIGVQYIIWDRWTWSGSRAAGSKERSYGGAHPHHDHLHVELSVEGGRAETPFFSGPMDPPAPTDCPALAAAGGELEETSGCFSAYGPAAYGRRESAGHGGSLLWTNAFESTTPSNWARWHLNLSAGGEYFVEVWAERGFAIHRAARYELRHGGATHGIAVDLSAGAGGWIRLGAFDFDAGAGQHLSVHDDTAAPVPADQRVPADAMRLVRVEDAPVLPPDDEAVVHVRELAPVGVISPMPGGDPSLDDDPLVMHDAELVGGCAVGGSAPDASWLLVLGLATLLWRRRRTRH